LDKIKEDRKSVFMNYMSQLKPILTQAYQILTERDSGSGRVDIFMENEAFPCDDGLYYTPVPPTKRFVYDLDQLSGGEKSIASLALQYSIALASKSPFLILD
jgi:structural maintenance of chromosome 1